MNEVCPYCKDENGDSKPLRFDHVKFQAQDERQNMQVIDVPVKLCPSCKHVIIDPTPGIEVNCTCRGCTG